MDFFYAGGIPAIMAELNNSELIHPQTMTVYGTPLEEMLKEIQAGVKNPAVIRTVENPVHATGVGLLLYGSQADSSRNLTAPGGTARCSG